MDKTGLLTIKEFSELTKVNPKSLRYYDALGILKPTYIDPNNGYRYYSVFQREMVYAIEMCVEAGIPLKRMQKLNYVTDNHIRYRELMVECVAIIEKKIARYQAYINNDMRDIIRRADLLAVSPVPITFPVDEFYCLIQPYEGRQHTSEWQKKVKELISQINRRGMGVVSNTGLLLKPENGTWKQYLFVSVMGNGKNMVEHLDLIRIPAGVYLRKKVDRSGTEQVWDWTAPYTSPENIELVIETELLTSDYCIDPPPLEQRCLIRQSNK